MSSAARGEALRTRSNRAKDRAYVELEVAGGLAGGQVELDGVVDLDGGVSVADGAAIVGGDVRDGALLARLEGVVANAGLLANSLLDDTAQLVLGLLLSDAVENEAALDVVQQTEVLVGVLDLNDVCTARVRARQPRAVGSAQRKRERCVPMKPAG